MFADSARTHRNIQWPVPGFLFLLAHLDRPSHRCKRKDSACISSQRPCIQSQTIVLFILFISFGISEQPIEDIESVNFINIVSS
jgi:hypothetical protein